jgi:hypothetical protein
VNLTRTAWVAVPSLPIPDTTYEDPPHQKPREITVEHAHKALLPPTKQEHDATLRALLGSFRHEASTSVSSARRRRHGVGRGQPLTDPSPGTIPQICSPSPALAASCPPPFRFHSRAIVFLSFLLCGEMNCDAAVSYILISIHTPCDSVLVFHTIFYYT